MPQLVKTGFITAVTRFVWVLAITLIAALPAHADDGKAKAEYVDTPLGQAVDGKIWSIGFDEERGVNDGVDRWDSIMDVKLQYRPGKRSRDLPYEDNYIIKMTIAERTRYQWCGDKKVERSEIGVSKRFNRLTFQGLRIGTSHPYTIEIRTSSGMRFVKTGKITFGPKHSKHVANNPERVREAIAQSIAAMNKETPGTRRHFDAKRRTFQHRLNLEIALVHDANADPSKAWEKMSKIFAEFHEHSASPQPGDDHLSAEDWAKYVADYQGFLIRTELNTHFDIPVPDSVGRATELFNQLVQGLEYKTDLTTYHRELAGLHYSFTGKAAPTLPHLLKAYDYTVQSTKDNAARLKLEYVHRPLAKHILPHDFEPITITRNEVQAQLCAAKQRALVARRIIASTKDRAERKEAAEALTLAKKDEKRLADLLGTIPGPSQNPRWATHQRVRNTTIARSFDLADPEAVKARDLALARYDDLIYVEPDNSVHGDFKAALMIAMPEAAPQTRRPEFSFGQFVTISGDNLEQIGKALQLAETKVDKTKAGYKILNDIAGANKAIQDLLEATDSLRNTSPEHLHRVKVLMARAVAIAEDGMLSSKHLALALTEVNRLPAKELDNLKDAVDSLKELKKLRDSTSLAGIADTLKTGFKHANKIRAADWTRIKEIIASTAKEAGSFELNALDKFVLVASAGQAVGSFIEQVDAGVDYREAGGRAFAQFGVDVAFTYFPMLGLVDMVTEVISVPMVRYTSGEWGKYNASDMTKDVLQYTLDIWSERMQDAGTLYEYTFHGVSTAGSLKNVDPDTIRLYLDRVECQLATFETDIYENKDYAASEPGKTAARLLRQRAVFRVLLRAHAEAGTDPWKVAHVNDHHYTISYPPDWKIADISLKKPFIHRHRITPPGFEGIDSELYMQIEIIPADSLKKMQRKATLPPADVWWEAMSGDAEIKQLTWIQEPQRAKRRGRPINLFELYAESPVSQEMIWLKRYAIIHADQLVEVRIVCPKKRLGEYQELLEEIESKFLMHPVKKHRP